MRKMDGRGIPAKSTGFEIRQIRLLTVDLPLTNYAASQAV